LVNVTIEIHDPTQALTRLLNRYHRLRRLRALQAPEPILSDSEAQVGEALDALAEALPPRDDWYHPTYVAWAIGGKGRLVAPN